MVVVLTTDQKGAIAELAIASLAARLGIGVSKPLSEEATTSSLTFARGSLECSASGRPGGRTSWLYRAGRAGAAPMAFYVGDAPLTGSISLLRTATTSIATFSCRPSCSPVAHLYSSALCLRGTTNTEASTGRMTSISPLDWPALGP
jgi:hypothetical protein